MNKLSTLTVCLLMSCFGMSCSMHSEVNQTNELNLNDIQMIGSHNSYKRPLNHKVLDLITQHDANAAARINYSHPSFSKQLELGLRHFEIDIVKDPSGGRFAYPEAEKLTQQTILTPTERALLAVPGFKVMHLPDLDFSSHCISFQSCLDTLLDFSNNQPNHLPIVVLMNLKETDTKLINGAEVLTFDAEDYAELDKVLLTTFGDKLLTPDDVRGKQNSLELAVLDKGWPTLSEVRGRLLFILDGKSHQLEAYRHGHTSLQGRAMFGSYSEGEPEAAFMIRNDPVKSIEQIKQLVDKGYLVRTRADGGAGSASQTADVKLRTQQAFASGAQIISTDFYPNAPQILPSDFAVSFKQGLLYRCNHKVRKSTCELNE